MIYGTPEIAYKHAFAMERAIRVYLATCGIVTIPVPEFCLRNEWDRGAPMIYRIDGDQSEKIIRPDLQYLNEKGALELKTQGYAPWFALARVYTTGFAQRQLDSYKRYEDLTAAPVSVAFAHLVEDEIRGGTLAEMSLARTARVNQRPGMVMFEYRLLPRWKLSLSEVLVVAVKHGRLLGREGYSGADHAAVLAYRARTAIPNYERHLREWGGQQVDAAPTRPAPRPPTLVEPPSQEQIDLFNKRPA